MAKLITSDLAAVLVKKKGFTKKAATKFVNELFVIVREGLQKDKIVKVRGLGTFKIIEVDDRESVNVNTGERVLIEGHSKISFTPDSLMKELVNKPFSQFETVVLNEGVDFSDNPVEIEPGKEEEAEFESEPDPTVILPDAIVEPESVVFPKPIEVPEPLLVSEPKPEVAPELEPEIEPEIAPLVDLKEVADDEESGFKWKKWLPVAALCILIFGGGFYFGKKAEVQQPAVKENILSQEVKIDSVKKENLLQKKQPEKPVTLEEDFDKYEKMDARIRTGAYRIVGTDHIEKVRSTDTLAKICKRTLGPGMECYLTAYNGIKRDADLKPGMEIKIPKLELKKKKAKKEN